VETYGDLMTLIRGAMTGDDAGAPERRTTDQGDDDPLPATVFRLGGASLPIDSPRVQ